MLRKKRHLILVNASRTLRFAHEHSMCIQEISFCINNKTI